MKHFMSLKNVIQLCFFLIAVSAVTLFGGTGVKGTELSEAIKTARARLIATKNRLALEAYEKRNAEITPWVEDVLHVNTDNAALLYYQACIFVPEPNESIRYEIRPNAGPTTEIRTYLGRCLPVIEMVEIASRIPGCIWGLWPKGDPDWAPLRRKIGLISDVLLVDAGTLAVDGHYRVAMERCLTVRRIAQHLGGDPELYIYETGLDRQALYMIRILLGMMPPDADILTWLRGQFSVVPGPRLSYAKSLQKMVEIQLDAMKTYPDRIDVFRNVAAEEAEGGQAREDVRNLTNEQFLLRAREGLARLTDSLFRILDGEATCNQKLAQMNEFVEQKMEDDATDPVLKGIISGMNMKGQINLGYTRQFVVHKAHVNGTKAAVEIYLVLAKTGRLPEKLPEYLPKDPFTDRDFEYQITDEGFTLRCEGNKFQFHKGIALEFRVHK